MLKLYSIEKLCNKNKNIGLKNKSLNWRCGWWNISAADVIKQKI